jgi:hypothetical protein
MLDFQHPDWHYGLSYTDNKSFVCPKIPKCASSWAQEYFLSLGWEQKSFVVDNLFELNALVFLREPKERTCTTRNDPIQNENKERQGRDIEKVRMRVSKHK